MDAGRPSSGAASTSHHHAASPRQCYNSCRGPVHGLCIPPGLCRCNPPWHGFDCGDGGGDLTAERHKSHSGFVYVFSPPDELGLAALRRPGRVTDPLYMAEVAFTERLMADDRLRTLDPNRAMLFYVPTFLLPLYTNTVYDKGVAHYHNLVLFVDAVQVNLWV